MGRIYEIWLTVPPIEGARIMTTTSQLVQLLYPKSPVSNTLTEECSVFKLEYV